MTTLTLEGHPITVSANSVQPTLGGHILTGKSVQLANPFGKSMYLRHGWQSWSEAAWVSMKENPKPILPPERRPQCDDPAYALSPAHGSSGLGAVEGYDGRVLFLGALRQGARVEADRVSLKGQAERDLEWFVAYGDDQQILARYAELLAAKLGVRGQGPAPRVWSSW